MATTLPRALIEIKYEKAAQDDSRNGRWSTSWKLRPKPLSAITLESMDLLKKRRPDVQTFNELLVQYPLPRQQKLGQVVPDNMVVLSEKPVRALRGASTCRSSNRCPFWVMEYVSKKNVRKDYEDNFIKYERALKVPYDVLLSGHTGVDALPAYRQKIRLSEATRGGDDSWNSILKWTSSAAGCALAQGAASATPGRLGSGIGKR